MSEFLAEAQVLIRPNTAQFAALLKAQLAAAVAEAGPVLIPVGAAPIGSGAGKALAAETAASTAAIEKNTASLQAQGVAAERSTLAQRNLARAEALQAEAQTLLAGAAEAASLKTTELAKARSVLATTSHAAALAEKAAAAATVSGNVAMQESTAVLLTKTKALDLAARAAVREAIANQASAAAALESAAAHSQATRGIVAETLALGGLRGATLAASAPFLIGATAAIVFAKSIKGASDATEEFNKTQVVFGDSADQITEFAETTATSLGISSTEALRAAAVFGNLFRAIKISEPVAADMSERLVRLASDLASFNNADPERTLEALRAGLVGQARPLRVFGAFLTAARVSQEALIETGKKSVQDITEREKVQARYNLILQDTILAQGDFARTSDQAANQSRTLKAQLQDMGDALGDVLIPAVTTTLGLLNDYVGVARRAAKATEDFSHALGNLPGPAGDAGGRIGELARDASKLYFRFALLGPAMGAATLAESLFGRGADDAAENTNHLNDALDAGARSARLAAFAIVSAAKAVSDLGQQLNSLDVQRLKIQTGLAPGGRAAEQANLRKQIDLDKEAVAASKSGTAARKQALLDLKADQDELAGLEAQDAADAQTRASTMESAASAREQAQERAARAQAEATQAFIDSFSAAQERRQNKLTSAELFGTANQQIAINKQTVAADKAEIAAIQAFIRQRHLQGDALDTAKATIAALNQEIFDTRNAIAKLVAERNQAIVDARQSHLEALLAIAETTSSTKDDAAAEKAFIKFDQAQIRRILAIKRRRRLTLDEAAQLDSYRVDLAKRNAALKGIKEESDNGAKKFKEFFFSQLQAQQGFAANLLGNLITGPTAGLVGVPSPVSTVTAEANRAKGVAAIGPTAGQSNLQANLLEKIVIELRKLNGSYDAPEAIHQKKVGAAAIDYHGV